MCKSQLKLALLLLLTLLGLGVSSTAGAGLVKGIYLTQTTMENTAYLNYLIKNAKAVGITAFVVDMEIPSKIYQRNVALLKQNNIQYIARVVVFPEGGRADQIASPAYWAKRYHLIDTAINYGANQIQLDYIRYNTHQPASTQNAKNILKVVQYYKDKLTARGIPMQADVFGITGYGESKHIGQNLRLMAQSVDALCPMVYPSHFEPFRSHAKTPYETIYNSLRALRSQFDYKMPVKLYAYIEISNYRYPLPGPKRRAYIVAEMKAVRDAGADGWYVWSAHNKYDYLFNLMGQLAKNDPDKVNGPVTSQVLEADAAQADKITSDDTSAATTTKTVATADDEATEPTAATTAKTVTASVSPDKVTTPTTTNTVATSVSPDKVTPAVTTKTTPDKVTTAASTPAKTATTTKSPTENDISLSINDPTKLTWTLRSHHYSDY
jgi:hypothetical protein